MATKTMKSASAKATHQTGRYVLIGSMAKRVPAGVLVCRHFADLPSTIREVPTKQRVFISYGRSSTEELLQAGMKLGKGLRMMGRLVTIEPPRPESVPSLSGLFEKVIGAMPGYSWLPVEELPTVLSGKEKMDRFIGGAADAEGKTVALVRGNL